MKKLLDVLKLLIGWPLSLAALFFIGNLVVSKSGSVTSFVTDVNTVLLFGGVICFVGYFFIRSIIWHLLLKEKGHNLPLYDVAYLWEISELKRFVPGNIWSFLSRSFLFTQKGIDKKIVWFSMMIEIQFFLISCILVSLLSIPLIQGIPFGETLNTIAVGSTFFITGVFIFHSKIPFLKNSLLRKILPDLSIEKNIEILLLSVFSLFLYGLGSYLTITAIVFLSPVLLISLIGFFVLSLLVGYVSLITPMGLGVREGIITSGLAGTIGVSAGAAGAIFSRLVLIVSEVIFLILTVIWRKTKSNILSTHSHTIILIILIGIYFLYFTSVSFLRHDNFYTGRFDLGNMDQVVWNSLHGNLFEFTNPNGVLNMSRLGFHADFILVLLAPFYALWSSPKMLLLIQSLVLSLGAVFVYMLSTLVLRNKTIALSFAAVYLLNPSVHYANLYDFHAVTLSTTFLLAAFYFVYKKSHIPFLLFLLLACITKEQVWLVGAFFGLYIFFVQKKKLLGASLTVAMVGFFYYLMGIAIPNARGGAHFALSYYSEFGDSPSSIIKNILLSPVETLTTAISGDRLDYLYQLFMPLGFLSLLSPLFLLFPAGDLGINLLSNNPQLHQIYYQYTAVITPFLFIAAIFGARHILSFFTKMPTIVVVLYLLSSTLLVAYNHGPLPGAKSSNIDKVITAKKFKTEIQNYLENIPHEKKVTTINNLGAHVSQREFLYTIPLGMQEADVIIFDLEDPYSQPSPQIQQDLIENLMTSSSFDLVFQKGSVYAFEKNKNTNTIKVQ